MNQITSKLRRAKDGYDHWCDGCQEMHTLPDQWKFNGDLQKPTFTPSFLHIGVKRFFKDGIWAAPYWVFDAAGNPIPTRCHYVLTDGILHYCTDSEHALAGQAVPLPDLPKDFCDGDAA